VRDIYAKWASMSEMSEEERQTEGYDLKACQDQLLKKFAYQIKRVEKLSKKASRVNRLRRGVAYGPTPELLMRYDAAFERKLDRALGRLERLQRMRLGRPGPPQIELKSSP